MLKYLTSSREVFMFAITLMSVTRYIVSEMLVTSSESPACWPMRIESLLVELSTIILTLFAVSLEDS
jgi:hypothetical protein